MIRLNSCIRWQSTLVLLSFAALACTLAPGALLADQVPAVAARITQPIDESNLVTLKGNRHPLAQARFDQGAAADSMPVNRILVLLQRSPAQEAALRQLLDQQQSNSSPNFHQWLTPAEFGQQFGPSDTDIATVTSWLQAHGFTVNRVSAGRTVIEISGTAGQVRNAFHTEIHKYVVNGESHWANNSDPQIPTAITPVVAGFASLNNFHRKPMVRKVGLATAVKKTPEAAPQWTANCSSQGTPTNCYVVGPYDFATIYNSLSLWTAATPIDGTGQTIAIVGDSNINCQDVTSFRNFFGLPVTNPNDCSQASSNVQVILDGPDPGINGDEIEADLDVDWSGAVAKGAHIDLVASEGTASSDGTDLSAEYIIDNNLAPVMSESFGACENALTANGIVFYEALWEQAAAQGITVVVSSGDSGSAGCDNDNTESEASGGLAVSGIASTPFNVAVGGTDFNDASTQSTYWNSTNATNTQESAKGYIPEVPWNDSCAATATPADLTTCANLPASSNLLNIVGGGGGESACASFFPASPNNNPACDKPAWQSGPVVPTSINTDGTRDIPDISLFAASGSTSQSFYPICESDQNVGNTPCDANSTDATFVGVGGTSSSAPAFAGMMAMVNQFMKAQTPSLPRQGNADFVLYALGSNQVNGNTSCNSNSSPNTTSGSAGCTFYDIAQGNNSVPCVGSSSDCSNTSSTSAAPGVLVVPNSNGSLSTTPGWSAGTNYDLATGLGSINAFNLVHNWPNVVGTFKSSATALSLCTGTSDSNGCSSISITITHGQRVFVNATVTSSSGTPTGDVALIGTPNTLANNSGSTTAAADRFSAAGGNADVYSLSGGNTLGLFTYFLIGGSYQLSAHYTGDGTFGASDSQPAISVTVNPENSVTQFNVVSTSRSIITQAPYGSPLLVRVDVLGTTNLPIFTPPAPEQTATGSVSLTDSAAGTNFPSGTYTLNTEGHLEVQPGENQIPSLNVGPHTFSASYLGDPSYNPSSTSATSSFTVTKAATALSLASNTTSVPTGTSVTLTAIVATGTIVSGNCVGSFGNNPTGTVTFSANGTAIPAGTVQYSNYQDPNCGFSELQATLTYTVSANTTITASYSGDSNYSSSTTASGLPLTAAATTGVTVAITNKFTTVLAGGSTITLNGTVTNDTGNKGVTWAIEFGSPLAQCTNTFVCGSLSHESSTGNGTSTSVSAVYTPPTEAPGSPNNMVVIVATSVLDPTKNDVDALSITSPLSVTIDNKLKNVQIGSAGVILNATLFNDTKNQGVTWAIAGPCTPNCGTFSNSGVAPSGTITLASVLYSPPCPAPVGANATGTITATSVLDNTKSDADPITFSGGTYCISAANTGISSEVNVASPGMTGTSNITVYGATGYNTPTTLTCTVIPSNLTDPPTCTFPSGTSTSAAVTLGAPIALSFKSTAASNAPPQAQRNFPSPPRGLLWIVAGTVLMFLMVLRAPQGRRGYALLALLLILTAGAAIACGGGSAGAAVVVVAGAAATPARQLVSTQ